MALKAYEPIVKAHPDEDLRFGIDHSQITTEGIIEEYARRMLQAVVSWYS